MIVNINSNGIFPKSLLYHAYLIDFIKYFDVIKGNSTNIDDFSTKLHQFSTNIDEVIIGRKKSTEHASISSRSLFFSTEHLDKIVHTFQTGYPDPICGAEHIMSRPDHSVATPRLRNIFWCSIS